MARRSPRIQELSQKNELGCVWGLFSILQSCQGRPGRKLISNGKPVNKHTIDYPRKLDRLTSFDEECRRIQNEAGLTSVAVDATARSVGNFIEEDTPIDKRKSKQNRVERPEHANMDSEFDRLVKTQKRARKSRKKSYQSSSCCLNNAGSLIRQLPSTSAEISLNELTLAAALEAVCAQNHQEESKLSEYCRRSSHLGEYDQVDGINIQQIQMRAKDFVDQMFIDKKFMSKRGTNSDSRSFTDALEALNSKKDLFMNILPDPNSLLARRIKNLHPSQTERETVKSILDAKFSECESLDASSSAEAGSALAMQKGNISMNRQKSDKIVILKPAPRIAKQSENVICHCSSLQSHSKSARRVSDAKGTYFSFRAMKKKLKHTFGVARKEPSQLSILGTSEKLSRDRSTSGVGDECICRGMEIKNSLNSSTNAENKGMQWKKHDLKSNRCSDIACLSDTTRKKLDFSSVKYSHKQEFDVIVEAKRHLSARLKNLNSAEAVTSERSSKKLGRILSSPEHDFRPLSPRRDSQYCPGSPQMRFSPYNTSPGAVESTSQIPNGRERACSSSLRSKTVVMSCDDHNRYDSTLQTMDARTCSPITSPEAEARTTDISMTDNMKNNGESKIAETNSVLQPELHISEQVLSELSSSDIAKTVQITDTITSQKEDEIVMHSIMDSRSANEAITSTVDDFPSTPLSMYQLDTADSIKHQEEHRSPVSVLEPYFVEDSDSPPSIMLQTATKQLQPRRLDFEECSFESFHHDPSISANSCTEEEVYLSEYVQLILRASGLNWDKLSEIRSPPEELLHASLFYEVEFQPADCYYDPKLLFDHINEVLLEIYECHFCSPPWLASAKPKIRSAPLAELVRDEIMTGADFYLLPTTERRTLDQLVSKDITRCRSWLDVRLDTEQIVTEISEDFLGECILDIVLEFHT